MAIKIGSNFTFQGKQPNFERDRFATKAAMKAFPETSIDDGHLSYCADDGNTYQFKSSNSVDAVTGKWRVFKADVDLSAYATKDSVAKDLAKKVDIVGKTVYSNTNIKVATIPVEIKIYRTISVTIDIRCREKTYSVDINIITDNLDNIIVKALKHSYITYGTINEKVYYYVDKSVKDDYKVIIFYDNNRYDTIHGKITATTKIGNKLPILNMEAIETIPEGVVEIMDVGYGNKNLFYATPKDAAGDPTFRAIDITDLPDLSSKYAIKEKAFTKDTASTEPNQFLAGPINTRGNIGLRKIDASDIPDLSSKYGTKAEITTINNSIADVRNKVNAMPKTVFITQAAYNALTTKDPNTIYYING